MRCYCNNISLNLDYVFIVYWTLTFLIVLAGCDDTTDANEAINYEKISA